jgi:hypothetical protein
MPNNSITSTSEVQHRDIPGHPGYKADSDGEVYAVHHPGNPAPGVEYRDITGFAGYEVGSDGSIWSCWSRGGRPRSMTETWRKLSQGTRCRNREGQYKVICLRKDGRKHCLYVHRLVLEAFVGPCPPGMECRHFPDPDPANNRLENLSWSTSKQNAADKLVHGTSQRGERNGFAKLTEPDVHDIRQLATDGCPQRLAARWFEVSQGMIGLIVRRKAWSWLEDQTDYSLTVG